MMKKEGEQQAQRRARGKGSAKKPRNGSKKKRNGPKISVAEVADEANAAVLQEEEEQAQHRPMLQEEEEEPGGPRLEQQPPLQRRKPAVNIRGADEFQNRSRKVAAWQQPSPSAAVHEPPALLAVRSSGVPAATAAAPEWVYEDLANVDRREALSMLSDEFEGRHGRKPSEHQLAAFSAMLDQMHGQQTGDDDDVDSADDESDDREHNQMSPASEPEKPVNASIGRVGDDAIAGVPNAAAADGCTATTMDISSEQAIALHALQNRAEGLWGDVTALSQGSSGEFHVPEGSAQVYPKARAMLSQDTKGKLLLGINCCAACAHVERGEHDCPACGKVGYCSEPCRQQDAANHAKVCPLLQVIEVDYQAQKLLGSPTGLGQIKELAAASAPATIALVEPCPPPSSLHAWSDVISPVAAGQQSHAAPVAETAGLLDRWALSAALSHPLSFAVMLGRLPAMGPVRRRLRGGQPVLAHAVGISPVECDVAAWDYIGPSLAALSPPGKGFELELVLCGHEVPMLLHKKRHSCRTAPGFTVSFFRTSYEAYAATTAGVRVDCVVGFNLGLSCSDYSWDAGLLAIQDRATSNMGALVPFVLTANTKAEAEQELDLLGDGGLFPAGLQAGRSSAGGGKGMARDGPPGVGFLERNRLGWLRPMQSGSMGNDVYRKSGWVFGDNLLAPMEAPDEDDSEEDQWSRKRARRQQRKNKRLKKRARR